MELLTKREERIMDTLWAMKKGFVNLALHGRAAMRWTEGDPKTAGGDEFLAESCAFEDIFGNLAGVIGHRAHGFSEMSFKAVFYRVINSPKDFRVYFLC